MMLAFFAAVLALWLCSPVGATFYAEGTNCFSTDFTSVTWPVAGGTRNSQRIYGPAIQMQPQLNACRQSQVFGVTRSDDVICTIMFWGLPTNAGNMGQGPAPLLLRSTSLPDQFPVATAPWFEVSYFCFHISIREDSELFQSVRDTVSNDMLGKIRIGQVSGPGSSGWGGLTKRDPAAVEAYIQATLGNLSSGAACWYGACFHLYMSPRLQHTCSVT